MGYPDDEGALTFLRNGDKNAMAITFFGTFNRIQRVPSRIPISVNTHRVRARKAVEHARDKHGSPILHDPHIRFLDSFKIWNEPEDCQQRAPCNQHLCSKLERRYDQHLLDKHTPTIKKKSTQCGESYLEAINKNSVTTSTTSVAFVKNSMVVLPDLDRHKSYVINKNNWLNNEGTNHDDDHHLNDAGFDDNPTKMKSDNDSSNKYNNSANETDYDSDNFHSIAKNSSVLATYNNNTNHNKDYKNNSRKNGNYRKAHDNWDQNTKYSDAGSSNSARYIKVDNSDYINNANLNGGSSNNGRHENVACEKKCCFCKKEQDTMNNEANSSYSGYNTNYNNMDNNKHSNPYGGSINKNDHRNVANDTNEQSSIPNDTNFSNGGHNTHHKNVDSNNIAKNNFGSSNHKNVANNNNKKPHKSISNGYHRDCNEEGNRKQFNGNNVHNMKDNAKYSGPKDEDNLNDISSKTTNMTKESNRNYNPEFGNNSVEDNNRVYYDAAPSKEFTNEQSSIPNDTNFSNNGHNTHRKNVDSNNITKNNFSSSNHKNVANNNNKKPHKSISNGYHRDCNEEGNRKQFNGNNMKCIAKHLGPKDEDNLNDISSKTTNITKGSNSNYNPEFGNNSVVDNNRVYYDAGPSKEFTNEQSSIPNDTNFSNVGHNTHRKNVDSNNIAKNNINSSNHKNVANNNNEKPNTSISNRNHRESNEEGNRKQFNGNNVHNMKYNAKYSGPKNEDNLSVISSKTTNMTSNSNYNPEFENNSVVDNNRVYYDAGPSKKFTNEQSSIPNDTNFSNVGHNTHRKNVDSNNIAKNNINSSNHKNVANNNNEKPNTNISNRNHLESNEEGNHKQFNGNNMKYNAKYSGPKNEDNLNDISSKTTNMTSNSKYNPEFENNSVVDNNRVYYDAGPSKEFTNEQSSIPNDTNFSNVGHNTHRKNVDSNNIAKNNFNSSNHKNVANNNNEKPNTSISNRNHRESNEEGNRKQFNGNNMKYNAKYSGPKNEDNLTDISSKTTNMTSNSNYNPEFESNSVVDNNRVYYDAGPSKELLNFGHNPNSSRADTSYVNRRANHNQHQDNLRPDAYPFNCGKQYMAKDAVEDAVNINRLHNTTDNTGSALRFDYKYGTVNFDTNENCSRPFCANRSNNHMDSSRRSLSHDNKNSSYKSIPLKRTDTREIVTPNRYIYKDCVETEIRLWLEDVPLYLNHSELERQKDDIVNILTTKIISLGDGCNNYCEQYEEKFKITVDQILSNLPMWYPGQTCDQISFRNNFTDNLYNKIKACNQNKNNSNYTTTYRDSYCKNDERNRLSLTDAAEVELSNWVAAKTSILSIEFDDATITEVLLKRLVPMLKNPVNPSTSKFNLKCAIAEVLNDLVGPHCSSRVNDIQLYKLAEDLAIGLLAIQAQYEQDSRMASAASRAPCVPDCSRQTECIIHREINKCLCATKFVFQDDIKTVIADIIINYLDPQVYISEVEVKEDILKELHRYCIPEGCAIHITQDILKEIKMALNLSNTFQTMCIPTIISKISAFASENIFNTFPVASTPNTREALKLNPEEIEYEEKVTHLIRSWMNTLLDFDIDDDDDIFKQTMVKDLAGEIVDQVKLEQISTIDEADNIRKHIVYRWVNKMNVYDINEIKEQIDEFLGKLKHIEVPIMTRPHRGNRQAMTQLREVNENFQEFHLPKSSDILEDEISIWMHAQPDIFNIDRDTRDKKIHEIVDVLSEKLPNKRPEEEILIDLTQWLDGIVKPGNRDNIGQIANDLKERVMLLPQDSTLADNLAKKKQERAEFFEEIDKKNRICVPVQFTTTDEDTINVDNTMRQFISKYIEHNYDVDDPLARGAFSHLLEARLQRLNPSTRKEVNDKPEEASTYALLPRGKLMHELDYIKDVSDWLKNIAVAPSFNTTGNRNRIDFVNDLAHNILDIEEEREAKPDAMDYNLYLASVIGQFIDHIPIENEHHNGQYMNFIIKQLITKIIAHRNTNYNAFNNDESVDTSGVNNDNIGDFIEEFILMNGSDIADDELKLEAWSVRLLNEIKKMVHENVLTKGEVYNQLLDVPMPGDETMKQFETEIEYIKEISQWIKNLPLLPVSETKREERIKMINELTEKVTERDNLKLNNPNDTKAESEFAEYIAKWIGDLSLDESREVVVAVVIQQLLNRIEKVKSNFDDSIQPTQPTIDSENSVDKDLQPIETVEPTENQHPMRNEDLKKKDLTKKSHPTSPATAMVETIEHWSESLPITGNEKEVSSLKNDVSKKLYQTVGELNIDPRTFNDDLLYKNTLEDEVDAVIENLPQNPELESNKKQLKDELVQNIVEAQQAIKENSAGQQYKHRLEHTIEASMPHPVKSRQAFDPGFQIYKSRLADMFILDNFDHANDDAKAQYEKTVKKEIEKNYPSVKNKNVVSLTNDEIYNELYGALFKVPVPNENSLGDEVEEIKTRCVIDMWYDKLPLIRTNNLSDLLERDKILATLAKRVHEIENSSSCCDNKLNNEIKKWLGKLPLLPGQEKNIDYFARTLEKELKSSTNQRKCLTNDLVKSKESKKGKTKSKSKDLSCIKSKPKKKAVDCLMAMVENWCLSLPIYSNRPQDADNDNILKDNLVTTIMIKLCELNLDPKTFNDDLLYDILLDEELDSVLRDVPKTCNFEDIKVEKKQQLKDAIRSIKPLFREEKAKHQYNQNLDSTVAKILVTSKDLTPKKEADFKSIKNDIVENFVQFTYDKSDDQSRQAHKMKIHDAVVKFVSENKNDSRDSLMLRNKLICELAKVPEPAQDTLKEDVEEIRMKNDITEFFKEQAIDSNDDKMNQVKSSLAVKLNELELNGYTPENEDIMKKEITKYMKNLNVDVNPDAVDKFVNELKDDEGDRRAPTKTTIDPCPCCTPRQFSETATSPGLFQFSP